MHHSPSVKSFKNIAFIPGIQEKYEYNLAHYLGGVNNNLKALFHNPIAL